MGINFYNITHEELYKLGFNFDVANDGIFQAQKDFTFEYVIDDDAYSIHNYWLSEELLKERDEWCTENLEGFFKLEQNRSSFEIEDDAMAFKLRWL